MLSSCRQANLHRQAKYHPLTDKRDLQNKAFGDKNWVLDRLLEACKDEIFPFCVRLAPEDVGLQAAKEVLKKELRIYHNNEEGRCNDDYCYTPSLDDYKEQQSKFQEAFIAFTKHLTPFLKDTPKLSQTEQLQGWFVFVELEWERCLKAWQKFYKLYKEECKAKGVKKRFTLAIWKRRLGELIRILISLMIY
ncbi:hypothetical protein NHP21005_06590 [Helicobacter sp. NHP21005]|uniref:hypothetical protein n=1 Tax=Helicobacter felistomachi TaxID=3040201 RepID=UPI0025743ED4|nr:hypothetical protein [Helicobacter sp. NHP21005]BEG56971.1 hypothetical protein NHP21005_06590 [Helicobacter sp. NHP21005]